MIHKEELRNGVEVDQNLVANQPRPVLQGHFKLCSVTAKQVLDMFYFILFFFWQLLTFQLEDDGL